MQETRDKCQKLDIQMEDFLEGYHKNLFYLIVHFQGVRESLTSLKKEEVIKA